MRNFLLKLWRVVWFIPKRFLFFVLSLVAWVVMILLLVVVAVMQLVLHGRWAEFTSDVPEGPSEGREGP